MVSNRIATTALSALALSLSLSACGETAEETATPETEATAEAPAGEVDVVKARHDNFEEIGDAFKAIRGQLEGTPDFEVIQANATIINTNAQKVSGYFPEGTGPASGADTEALETIWEKPEEFSAATDKLVTASETMLAAAGSGDPAQVGAAVKELGGSCKNCHDQFREEDD